VRLQGEGVALTRPDGILVRRVHADDPVMSGVRDLCYETLHRPFGVTRDDDWNERDPASTHFCALDGDRLAGYARLIVENGAGHLRQVSVAPAYRGAGIAGDLVACAVARARELGLPLAFLNARVRAVDLYERLGFRVTQGPFRMGRTFLPHVRMELPLR
jgi:ribosomal protein S18 acetylase RimI-like enzyme